MPPPPTTFQLDASAVIASALTLTAALAWNEAAKNGIRELYPDPSGGSFRATLLYATVVTVLIVIIFAVMRTLGKVSRRMKGAMAARRASGARRPAGSSSG